jgi:aspartyl-tRNA(Asn)/glutamyl-tRNA(Gln) amidotransferase subunit C
MSDELDALRIRHLAELAGLSLDDEEIASFAHDLQRIVAYVHQLSAVDTARIEPHEAVGSGGLRDDVVTPCLTREEALAAAPRTSEGGFAVPGFVSGAR